MGTIDGTNKSEIECVEVDVADVPSSLVARRASVWADHIESGRYELLRQGRRQRRSVALGSFHRGRRSCRQEFRSEAGALVIIGRPASLLKLKA